MSDVDHAVALCGRHRAELAYVMRRSLEVAQSRGGLYTLPHGMLYAWHRRDGQSTIHAICSEQPGTGVALLALLMADCIARGQHGILAKCPAPLPANAWYARRGFTHIRTDAGRIRPLLIWWLDVRKGD